MAVFVGLWVRHWQLVGPDAGSNDSMSNFRNAAGFSTSQHIEESELDLTKVVGEGAFGRVWKGTWKEHSIAAKQIRLGEGAQSEQAMKETIHEVREKGQRCYIMCADCSFLCCWQVGILVGLRHPNIMRYWGVVSIVAFDSYGTRRMLTLQ